MKNRYKIWWVMLALLSVSATPVDPTRPPNFSSEVKTAEQPVGTLQLSAIFVYPNYKFAIINNQRLTIGDKIGQYTVTGISKEEVELTAADNRKETLALVKRIK